MQEQRTSITNTFGNKKPGEVSMSDVGAAAD